MALRTNRMGIGPAWHTMVYYLLYSSIYDERTWKQEYLNYYSYTFLCFVKSRLEKNT